jgi:hypothetical protein
MAPRRGPLNILFALLRTVWWNVHARLLTLRNRIVGRPVFDLTGLREVEPEASPSMFVTVIANACRTVPAEPPFEVLLTPEKIAEFWRLEAAEGRSAPAENDPTEAWRRLRQHLRDSPDVTEVTISTAGRKNALRVKITAESEDRIHLQVEDAGPVDLATLLRQQRGPTPDEHPA